MNRRGWKWKKKNTKRIDKIKKSSSFYESSCQSLALSLSPHSIQCKFLCIKSECTYTWVTVTDKMDMQLRRQTKKQKQSKLPFTICAIRVIFVLVLSPCEWNLAPYGIVQGDQWLYEPLKHVRHYADLYMCTPPSLLATYAYAPHAWKLRNFFRYLVTGIAETEHSVSRENVKLKANQKTSFMDRVR